MLLYQLARKAARMWNANANTLLLLLVAAAQTTQSNGTSSSSEHVPPLPLNISKHTTTTNDETTTSNINKVPTSIAAGPAVGFMPLQQTPASIFFINYNQQNVVQLRNNLEAKLHSIRKFEMLVAKIQVRQVVIFVFRLTTFVILMLQEIFDSINFASSVATRLSPTNANESVQQELQVFSQRLGRKLQRATHVVQEMRDLLRYNLSKVLQQEHLYDDDEYDDHEIRESDFLVEDGDSSNAVRNNEPLNLYLNTQIESCQSSDYEINVDAVSSSPAHYNKQQIQILNYLKSDESSHVTFLNENNERSRDANAYITDQLTLLRQRLSKIPSDTDSNSSSSNNIKASNSISHFKHIFFLSNSDGAPSSAHFRHLYVSAIKRKFVMLLVDVGSAMNAELFELTKNFGKQ